MSVRVIVCMAALLVATLAIEPSAMADEPTSPENGAVLKTDPDEFLPEDLSAAEQFPDVDTDAASDLEATRTAIERRSGPAISVGVSGWVGGQIIGRPR